MTILNPGDVVIKVNGVDYTLKPSLRALDGISSTFSGLAKAREALVAQDFNSVISVIRLGLNLNNPQANLMREQVYQNGLTADLLIPLLTYLGVLSNGGKPMPDMPTGDEDASTEGNA